MASSLFGRPGERWHASEALGAMRQSLAGAARPSWLWLAGYVYPSVDISLGLIGHLIDMLRESVGVELAGLSLGEDMLKPWSPSLLFSSFSLRRADGQPGIDTHFLALLWVVPILCRLAAGLARVAHPRDWERAREGKRSPRLTRAWDESRGMTFEVVGLWCCLQALLVGTVLVVMGPILLFVITAQLKLLGDWLLLLMAVPLLLLVLYAGTLSILNQLAMPSLVLNRRGAASALTHAWRLVRNDPWAAVRAALVDVGLSLLLLAARKLVYQGPSGMAEVAEIALYGFAGVARARYWSRVYVALGGLRPDEPIPGLPPLPSGAAVVDAGARAGGA